jgi:hypothetical protein
VPGSAPSVDNDLLSSLGETLLVFEHLFDTRYLGVSRAGVCRWRWSRAGVYRWRWSRAGVDRWRGSRAGVYRWRGSRTRTS